MILGGSGRNPDNDLKILKKDLWASNALEIVFRAG
jgi:hypothetical protein